MVLSGRNTMRLVALLLIVIGLAAIGFGIYPWIALWLLPSKPYHYYYVEDSARITSVACILIGVVAVGLGLWLATAHPRTDV